MYNDEHNLYHYTYRKDGSEAEAHPAPQPGPVQDHNSGSQQPVQEMKPVKKNRIGLKVTALALCCALLGGAVGGGIVWGVGRSGDETSVNVSGRTVSQVALKTVDGKTAMSDAEVYAANVNSVVSINVTGTNSNNFFGQPVQTASSGSGFILTTDGYIVTNYHVAEGATQLSVTFADDQTYAAQLLGYDSSVDIALLGVPLNSITSDTLSQISIATIGDSDDLMIGEQVVAIGNALGYGQSVTTGIISALDRTISSDSGTTAYIQTDAAINPGNSGGALLNMEGELIGINTAKVSSTDVEGMGYAIPISQVLEVISSLMN